MLFVIDEDNMSGINDSVASLVKKYYTEENMTKRERTELYRTILILTGQNLDIPLYAELYEVFAYKYALFMDNMSSGANNLNDEAIHIARDLPNYSRQWRVKVDLESSWQRLQAMLPVETSTSSLTPSIKLTNIPTIDETCQNYKRLFVLSGQSVSKDKQLNVVSASSQAISLQRSHSDASFLPTHPPLTTGQLSFGHRETLNSVVDKQHPPKPPVGRVMMTGNRMKRPHEEDNNQVNSHHAVMGIRRKFPNGNEAANGEDGQFRTANDALADFNARQGQSRGGFSGPRSNVRLAPPAASLYQMPNEDVALPKTSSGYGVATKTLGGRRNIRAPFVPPLPGNKSSVKATGHNQSSGGDRGDVEAEGDEEARKNMPESLKKFEPRIVQLIMSEIMDQGSQVTWNDIAGLEFVKKTLREIVILPMLRPDLFTGLRGPPQGLLLFGPPGTGKTLIGKCIASQSKSTFFSISASSLTSKWIGEGEKMVRVLFAVARHHKPAVVFIDEIDSLLSQRSDQEHESSRRIKTEFLVQLDGVTTGENERLLVVGATNRPQEIDEAARRRFVKRLYVPLPSSAARCSIVDNLLREQKHSLSPDDVDEIVRRTDGYSGADMANLCREAAMGPIRSVPFDSIEGLSAEDVRPISQDDFLEALNLVKASVCKKDLGIYYEWNKLFGSYQIPEDCL